MKNKFSILLICGLLLALSGFSQDSTRTKNDKPGTPQSLRTIDNAPQSHVNIINTNTDPNQTINHGALESNKIENTKDQTNNNVILQTPPATINTPAAGIDSAANNSGNSKKSNVTNPVRK